MYFFAQDDQEAVLSHSDHKMMDSKQMSLEENKCYAAHSDSNELSRSCSNKVSAADHQRPALRIWGIQALSLKPIIRLSLDPRMPAFCSLSLRQANGVMVS
jgi:hypothetical protein